ncbi:zinc finger protein ZPR1 isoform X1 [Gopherus flavomarginatus]|uniref:zinc finger protein ZPR1 isoform X1 n=1 Tax=Gopherus flavomarginatus TaxID=286002 RepID=UPI0021CBEF91|nr:zinc finger protein ZPR1 isoform X1 [Gopherus flavomarginatus]
MSAIGQLEPVRGGPLFRPLSAEDEEQQPDEIESLCMSCYRNGVTRLLLTKIPFFKEIIVSSFTCSSCAWSNTEIQSVGRIQEQGVRYTLAVTVRQDMNREVVKTDCATARIPELDFEIPAFSQKGALTTIEGIIDRAVAGLEQDQPVRRAADKDVAGKIDEFIGKLKQLKEVDSSFTFIIDDPSGNSFVENPCAPQKDDALVVTRYRRTAQQDAMLGLEAEETDENPADSMEDLRNEVLQFNTNCPECNAPANTNMKLVQIPHFKEVIIMATNCEACGHRTNEVKSGGAIEPLGTRITLRVTDPSDMTRDVLKSETCSVEIPELEFELGMGALGGKFTTVEGLLKDIRDLIVKNPFTLGDSSTPRRVEKLQAFGRKVYQIMEGHMEAHFILDDPAGNSYLQNVYAPEEDPELKVEYYERTFAQNEDLGLNDMRTEGYESGLTSER